MSIYDKKNNHEQIFLWKGSGEREVNENASVNHKRLTIYLYRKLQKSNSQLNFSTGF